MTSMTPDEDKMRERERDERLFKCFISNSKNDTDTENDAKTSLSLFFKTIELLSEGIEYTSFGVFKKLLQLLKNCMDVKRL